MTAGPRPLEALIREAAQMAMGTTRDREAQRRSWVVSEYMLEHPEAARLEVESLVDSALALRKARVE